MSPEQLWTTARRILGAYFLITGALYIPLGIAAFGYQTAGVARWPLVVAPLCQAAIALVAGWWLIRATALPSETSDGAKKGVLAPVVQIMGVYFAIEGLTEAVALAINMYFFGEAWQVRIGTFVGAVVKLAAGVLLVTKSSAVVERMARFSGMLAYSEGRSSGGR